MAIFGGWAKARGDGKRGPVLDPNEVVKSTAKDSVDVLGPSSPIGKSSSEGDEPTPIKSKYTAADAVHETVVANVNQLSERPLLAPPAASRPRRFSFRALGFFYGHQATLSIEDDHSKKEAAKDASKRTNVRTSRSDRRAQDTAFTLRTVMIGSAAISPASGTLKARAVTKPQLKKIKSQLMQPKEANRIIAQLRALPMPNGPVVGKSGEGRKLVVQTSGPIHAVCLEATEAEADDHHFSKLTGDETTETFNLPPSVTSASLSSLIPLFNNLHIVTFTCTPDFGLGHPGDEEGVLSGAVPTAETVMNGVMQITPQLMALGFATGKAVLPDHTGIYPPLDRMSIITYWWGLELTLPPPTMKYLNNAKSISNAILNFLTALSLINGGVREILPFIRYIAQFLDFEWSAIKNQDKGKGVVCAATWIMPAAMVPRPWDFPDPLGKRSESSHLRIGDQTARFDSNAPDKDPSGVRPSIIPLDRDDSEEPRTSMKIPSFIVTPATLTRNTPLSVTTQLPASEH